MKSSKIKIMEVCGTHTSTIVRGGIRATLDENISLVSGPGCPVCVTPSGAMDVILQLSENKNILIASYGDMIRVPGSTPGDNLLRRRARGASIEIVYSPMDALQLAAANPGREIVFLGGENMV